MRIVYTLLLTVLLPIIVLRLFVKARKLPAYKERIGERFAINSLPALNDCIWIHAVSVGETVAATPMIRQLQAMHPNTPILVTTTTPTGSAQLTNTFGDSVYHTYLPYDLPVLMERFLRKVKPKCLLIMETELWPNTIHCVSVHCPVALINARLSDKSFRGYHRFAATMSKTLNALSLIAASDARSAERFQKLGYAQTLETTGNIKFDGITLTDNSALRAEADAHNKRVLFVAGSTHDGEETQLLDMFGTLSAEHPELCLVLAPRHPERFEGIAKAIQARGLNYAFSTDIASRDALTAQTQVLLVNQMGVLTHWYSQSDIAFVGGSLVPIGGHNVIEPMASMIPVITGKHTHNFASIIADLKQAEGICIVDSSDALGMVLERFITTPEHFTSQVDNATAYVHASQGALAHVLTLLDQGIIN